MHPLIVGRGASFEKIAQGKLSDKLKFQQSDEELSMLFDHLGRRQFRGFIEIGVASGRTSWILAGLVVPGGTIAGIDPYTVHIGQCRPVARRVYAALAKEGFTAKLFERKSAEADTIKSICAFLAVPHRTIDHLHVDGSHMRDDVLKDLALYQPFVAAGGTIQFHDIATRKARCEAWKAWPAIKKQFAEHHEFKTPSRSDMGIGLVRLPQP